MAAHVPYCSRPIIEREVDSSRSPRCKDHFVESLQLPRGFARLGRESYIHLSDLGPSHVASVRNGGRDGRGRRLDGGVLERGVR